MSDNNNPERTFSQDEVNRIVADRLKAERSKIMKEAEQRAAELDRRESLLAAKADWAKRGLPADLLDSIDISNPDALAAAERALKAYQQPSNGGFEGGQDIGGQSDTAAVRNAFGLPEKPRSES